MAYSLRMAGTNSEPPGWSFEVEEVSNGVYEARGRDALVRTVSRKGTDPDSLLVECMNDAREITTKPMKL